ncbi:hypothetical protein EI94DRAFT_1700058 [Lactarius quietus]|nr:hypothetical protein EI94DRAFT_1700058 [Lactarius quietus]
MPPRHIAASCTNNKDSPALGASLPASSPSPADPPSSIPATPLPSAVNVMPMEGQQPQMFSFHRRHVTAPSTPSVPAASRTVVQTSPVPPSQRVVQGASPSAVRSTAPPTTGPVPSSKTVAHGAIPSSSRESAVPGELSFLYRRKAIAQPELDTNSILVPVLLDSDELPFAPSPDAKEPMDISGDMSDNSDTLRVKDREAHLHNIDQYIMKIEEHYEALLNILEGQDEMLRCLREDKQHWEKQHSN